MDHKRHVVIVVGGGVLRGLHAQQIKSFLFGFHGCARAWQDALPAARLRGARGLRHPLPGRPGPIADRRPARCHSRPPAAPACPHATPAPRRAGAGQNGALEVLTSPGRGESRDPGERAAECRTGGSSIRDVLGLLGTLFGAAPPLGESQNPQLPVSRVCGHLHSGNSGQDATVFRLPSLPLLKASKIYYRRRLSQS